MTLRSLVVAGTVALASAGAVGATTMALAPGDPAPPLRGWTLDGTRTILDYGAARLTVVNFWASWCEPCKGEMRELQRLHGGLGGAGLQIVGVVQDHAGNDELRDFVTGLGVTYTVIQPWKRYRGDWGGIGTLPTTFLIDSEGKVRRRYIGATEEQIAGMLGDIAALLEGRPLGSMIIPEKSNAVTEEDRPRKE